MTAELTELTIAEASARMDAGTLMPTALLEACLARIDATDGAVHAYVRLMRDSALEEARAADARAASHQRRGPLDGIPVGVKDLFDTAGVITAAGTSIYADRVPAEDATAVRLLREAGAVIVGKTNTHELALGGTTNNVHFGATHNPWDLDRVPGGSSGGSGATVAALQVPVALGTDTGGSIRIPAAFCGVTGIKPTYGLVGRGGVVPLALTLDHVGPIARSALDCALTLNVLAGLDARDYDSVPRPHEDFAAGIEGGVQGLTLAVVPSLVEGCEAPVVAAFERALEVLASLGARIASVEPMAGVDDWRALLPPIIPTEGATHVEEVLRTHPEAIGEPVRTRILTGLATTAQQYIRAREMREVVEQRFERALVEGGIDAYLAPTAPFPAEPIGDSPLAERSPGEKFRNTVTFDWSHQPSVSVPMGFDGDGMPLGLMITARLWQDALALRIAHAFQGATDFHRAQPTL
jgi:aspartyl-tRNA(Asn)/glutamyl-tRNA(Gln) amidotransferase subunit A